MTPAYHTIYSIALFLVLSCLLAWSKRHQPARRELRQGTSLATLRNAVRPGWLHFT